MATLKEWVDTAKDSRKTRATLGQLSVVDFYRFLYPSREPRCKRYYARGCIHGFKKRFYRWGHDVWNPWIHKNKAELLLSFKNFSLGGCGIILYFKAKAPRNYQKAVKYMDGHEVFSPKDLQEHVGASEAQSYNYIRLLSNKGLIHHCQPRVHGKPLWAKNPWWDEEKAVEAIRKNASENTKKYGSYKR